jgi:GT2 family glycosyltransferase/Tfp pilus assembly protein PilF
VLGDWHTEEEHRRAAQEYLLEKGFTHALIPDGDEVIEPRLLQSLMDIAEKGLAERVYVEWDTYWKSPEYVIRPRERFTPLMLIALRAVTCVKNRHYEGGRGLFLSADHGIVHHLSYVGPDERIWRKIETWGHANEVAQGWYENIWLAWDADKLMRNLHPTHPQAYGFAERVSVPEILQPAMERFRELSGLEVGATPAKSIQSSNQGVSIVIPLHGGEDDIRACLDSLDACRDLLHEVIVVDNASPDRAAELVEARSNVALLRNETNQGFAAACNQGWQASTGDVVVFLNSDTVVPRAGLEQLTETLLSSGSVGAAGPLTNRSGHLQQIDPTYTSLENLDLFAQDFAQRPAEDEDCDMLVGFCLAVKRSVLDELGGFDERFGLGTFEDNDLCYRMRRAGYRLMIAARSFIHHSGSQTFGRLNVDAPALLAKNEQLYREKWREDIEAGFASALSGLTLDRVAFEPAKHPDQRRKKMAEKAKRAGISLCMIVKNEERVLADALSTAKPFFSEMIVVDTGSTDRTIEIAKEAGAQVYEFPWTESFAEARNVSLKNAAGRWIFWMDADDTLPWHSGEALVETALHAPRDVAAFVVPVQFIDDGTMDGGKISGTRVDHVKLFRNMKGLQFEGRIHEQILPSLRAHGGHKVARCEAVVLHSGYDTSVEGQARKRKRDMGLLCLELRERRYHPFVLFNIGMTYHYTGDHRRGERWLKKCIEFSPETDSHVRKAYSLQAVSQRELGRAEDCVATLERGLQMVGADPDISFQLGLTLANLGRIDEAKRHYEAALKSDVAGHFSSVDTGIMGYKTYHNLGALYLAEGDYAGAKTWWLKAVENAPGFAHSAIDLFHAAIENSDLATARKQLDYIRTTLGPTADWAEMGAKLAEAVGGEENAETFLQSAAAIPHGLGAQLVLARRWLRNGHSNEAVDILRNLERAGVAEAAYFLGIQSLQSNQLHQALDWMRRARELNPSHVETQEQIAGLEEALGVTRSETKQVSFDEACAQVGRDLGLDPEDIKKYAAEDDLGGYAPGPMSPRQGRWPGGSVWSVEGKMLYAVTRILKPEIVVEIGSAMGCSASHLALAVCRNGQSTVYAIDPAMDFSQVDPKLLQHIVPVKQDALTWTPPGEIGMVFEDGPHTPGFTQSILVRLRTSLQPDAVIFAHDACHHQHGAHIQAEMQLCAPAGHGVVLIEPSDCGLGYGRVIGGLT